MTTDGIVDWGLGRRVAGALARGEDGANLVLGDDAIRRASEAGLDRVLGYTGLDLASEIPAVEAVTQSSCVSRAVFARAGAPPLRYMPA